MDFSFFVVFCILLNLVIFGISNIQYFKPDVISFLNESNLNLSYKGIKPSLSSINLNLDVEDLSFFSEIDGLSLKSDSVNVSIDIIKSISEARLVIESVIFSNFFLDVDSVSEIDFSKVFSGASSVVVNSVSIDNFVLDFGVDALKANNISFYKSTVNNKDVYSIITDSPQGFDLSMASKEEDGSFHTSLEFDLFFSGSKSKGFSSAIHFIDNKLEKGFFDIKSIVALNPLFSLNFEDCGAKGVFKRGKEGIIDFQVFSQDNLGNQKDLDFFGSFSSLDEYSVYGKSINSSILSSLLLFLTKKDINVSKDSVLQEFILSKSKSSLEFFLDFSNLSLSSDNLFELSNFDFSIYGKDDKVSLFYPDQEIGLYIDKYLDKSQIKLVNNSVVLTEDDSYKYIHLYGFDALVDKNVKLDADLTLSISKKDSSSVFAAIDVNVEANDLSDIKKHLGADYISPKLKEHLTAAFKQGSLKNGRFLLLGLLNRFPFTRDSDGVICYSFDLSDLTYYYYEDYPDVVDGKLRLLSRSDVININLDTYLNKIFLKDVHVDIDYRKKNSDLDVSYNTNSIPYKSLLQIVSSMKKHEKVGDVLSFFKVKNPLPLSVSINIMLFDDSAYGNDVSFITELNKNDVEILDSFLLEDVDGNLNIINSSLFANFNSGLFLKNNFSGNLTFSSNKDKSQMECDLLYQIDLSNFGENNKEFLDGVSDSSLTMLLTSVSDKYNLEVDLLSNMKNLYIDTPFYSKKVGVENNLRAHITSNGSDVDAVLDVDSNLSFIVNYIIDSKSPLSITLLQGSKAVDMKSKLIGDQKDAGFYAYIDSIDFKDYFNFYKKFDFVGLKSKQSTDFNSDSSSFLDKISSIKRFSVKSNDLLINGNSYGSFLFEANKNKDNFTSLFKSKIFNCYLDYFADDHKLNISGNSLSYVKGMFDDDDEQNNDKLPSYSSWPSLKVIVDLFDYKGMFFTDLKLQGTPYINGYSFNKINFKKYNSNFNAKIRLSEVKGSSNFLELSYKSDSFSPIISIFNKDFLKDIVMKNIEASVDLFWPSSSIYPDISNIDGNVKFKSGSGAIKNIKDKDGIGVLSFLSFLSLDSIVGKIASDEDISDGFQFDSITSNLTIKAGVVSIKKFEIISYMADVSVSGKYDTNDKSIDVKMSIFPHYTSSLPVLLGVLSLGNPVSPLLYAITGFIIEKAVSPIYEQAGSFDYKITGTLDKPIVKEIN